MTWITTSKTHQNGEPVTRRVKIPSMNEAIWFTDNAYAEVSDEVADILSSTIESITKSPIPDNPGEYYGEMGDGSTIILEAPDGIYDSLTVSTLDVDSFTAETFSPESVEPITMGTESNPMPSAWIESLHSTRATTQVRDDSTVIASEFASFDAARQYAVDNNYDTIFVPAGEYTESCNVPPDKTVVGVGDGTHFNASGTGASVGERGHLENVRISSGTGSTDDGIDTIDNEGTIRDVTIESASRHGVLVRGRTETLIEGLRFNSVPGNMGVSFFSGSSNNIINHSFVRGGIDNSGSNTIGDEVVII